MFPMKPTPLKFCEKCNKQLERKRFKSGRLMSLLHFSKMKYCNRDCMKKAFKGRWKENVLEQQGNYRARQLVITVTGCSVCGKLHRREDKWDKTNHLNRKRNVLGCFA